MDSVAANPLAPTSLTHFHPELTAHGGCPAIVDYRALWSPGVDPPPAYYSFQFWWAYTQCCRALAIEAGVSMRVLDRALWQYSKEHQPSAGASGEEVPDPRERLARSGPKMSKSAMMRSLYEEGQTVAQVAKVLTVNYAFAYGVHRRWRDSKAGRG